MKLTPALLRWRSLVFHAQHHVGVVLAAAVAATVLIGALTVGDSVRETLRRRALDRIGTAESLLDGGDRFFMARPGGPAGAGLSNTLSAFALRLPGVVARQDGSARANQVRVYGVTQAFWALSPASVHFGWTITVTPCSSMLRWPGSFPSRSEMNWWCVFTNPQRCPKMR